MPETLQPEQSLELSPECAIENIRKMQELMSTIVHELEMLKSHELVSEEVRERIANFLGGERVKKLLKEQWNPDELDRMLKQAESDPSVFNSIVKGGYSQGMLHSIFRLKYIVDAYFSDNKAFSRLNTSIEELATITNQSTFQTDIPPKYPLLKSISQDKANTFKRLNRDDKIRGIPSITEKVWNQYERMKVGGKIVHETTFLVDIKNVPVFIVENGSREVGLEGTVICMSPSAWEDPDDHYNPKLKD